MGSIYKRGNTYYIDYRVNGKRFRKRIGKSKQVADLALKDIEVKIAKNEIGFLTEKDKNIREFFPQYLEYSKTNHSTKTFTRYRAITDHFLRFLDEHPYVTKLSQLRPKLFEDYKTRRKSEWVTPNGIPIDPDKPTPKKATRGAKSNTINMELGTLRTIFNQAIKWDYLKENPTKGVNMLKVTDAKPPRFLTNEECEQLLQNCGTFLYPIFFTFLNTGMRLSELLNLEWVDIDFTRRKIKIRRKEFWIPKTGEREIPMNSGMFGLLQQLKKENIMNSNFIFHGADGKKLKIKLREELMKITKKCGFPDVTKIHSLRHTFASHLVMKGVDLPTIQKLMGHSDIQTTMIYSHLAPDHLVEAVDRLDFENQKK